MTFGDQLATKWLPLLGITYDAKADLVEIALRARLIADVDARVTASEATP